MTSLPFERWPDFDTIFEQALEVPEEKRESFLREACHEAEMLEELRAFLEAERSSQGIIRPSPDLFGLDARALADGAEVGVPSNVGPYRLIEIIGRGGAATVFRAERIGGEFQQQVALKLLHPSVHGPGARARFRQERQILASLRHPNIAHLIDGGVTEHGQPYIVMELVDGQPIDQYCDRLALAIEARLGLFQVVCEAVHAAHQRLIVHRDIKPSNVLVTDDGVVKLLDFGIAKLLEPGEFEGSAVETQTGVLPMTPAYASPEQVVGLAVTTATDIYQLGGLAYELLTGRRVRSATETSLAALRAHLSSEPEPPSRVIGPAGPLSDEPDPSLDSLTAAEIGRRRNTDPARLRRQLKGDLDQIVRKALQPEAARRYASAQALANDVSRYLDGLPVLAQADTPFYRLRKFVFRHPWGTAASSAALLIVLFLGSQLVSQFRRTVEERDRADAVITFMVQLFDFADPRGVVGDTVTVRAILDDGAERIDRELAQQPLVGATMQDAIGKAYFGLGRYDEASAMIGEALETRRSLLKHDSPEIAMSLLSLAEATTQLRRLEEASVLHEEALAAHIRIYGRKSPETAVALSHLAFNLQSQGRRGEAKALYEGALAVLWPEPDGLPGFGPAAATAMTNLAWIHVSEGSLEAATRHLERALAIRTELDGPDHPAVANTLIGLIQVARAEGAWDSMATLSERVLRIRTTYFGDRHPAVGDALVSKAQAAQAAGDLVGAEAAYRSALSVFEGSLGLETQDAALVLNNLGGLLRSQGRFQDAETVAWQARDAYAGALGHDHPFTGIATHNLATTIEALERSDEAEALYREALAIMSLQWPDDHPSIAMSRSSLGSLLAERGAFEEGASLTRAALQVLEERLAPADWRIGMAQSSLGVCLAGMGMTEEADSLLTAGYDMVTGSLGPDRPEVALVAARLAGFRSANPP